MSEAKYMAHLIDASKLNFHCNYNGDCLGDISHCKECDNYVLEYRNIQEQPTAYDVDKVVRQLEKDKFIDCETVLSDVHQGYNAGLSRAIEIVKAGGKNDD